MYAIRSNSMQKVKADRDHVVYGYNYIMIYVPKRSKQKEKKIKGIVDIENKITYRGNLPATHF